MAAVMIEDVSGRKVVGLDGKWQVIVDPYENGFYDYRRQPLIDGFFRNRKPADKTDLVEYDFDASDTLDVPGDWNSQRPELLLYEGSVWYEKSFGYEKTAATRLIVHFGAVSQRAVVYLN